MRTYRSYHLLELEVPSDIKQAIYHLYSQGFYPVQKFRYISFDVESRNPIVNAKFFLLGLNHRLLEKTYSVGNGYDNLNITSYAVYINMKSGEIFSTIVDILDLNEGVIRMLEDHGYVPIENSFYQILINQQESEMKR